MDYVLTKGIGGHHRGFAGRTNEWLTPPSIIKALGPFDLDPCAPVDRPWDTATRHFTIEDDGLSQQWKGRIWLNPPYGRQMRPWLSRLAAHCDGIALVLARVETETFFRHVWPVADAILFLRGRLNFYDVDGIRSDNDCGAPSVLVAYGERNARKLRGSRINGAFIALKENRT